VPYRTIPRNDPRSLVVPNYPVLTAALAVALGLFFALTGCVLSPLTGLIGAPAGGEVVLSATGTVFVLAGVTMAVLGVRMRRSRTHLALDASNEELTVTVGAASRHVVRVDDIEHVGVETADDGKGPTYRTRIVVRGGPAILVGDAMTSARGHYERVAEDIRHFLAADR
jgi:hypothetical protein